MAESGCVKQKKKDTVKSPCSFKVCEDKPDPCDPWQGSITKVDKSTFRSDAPHLHSGSVLSNKCLALVNWRDDKVRKTVDNLLDKINKSSCCGICPTEHTGVSCDKYRDLLKIVQRSTSSKLTCRQSDGSYERDIIEEIRRRMTLGICGSNPKPPPALDYVQVPKKRAPPKKAPPKEKKPPKVKKPPPPKPKPITPQPPPVMFTKRPVKIEVTPAGAGIIQYRLSEREFIRKGWTILPQEDSYKTFYTFQAEPCGPLLNPNVYKKKQNLRYYADGRLMARIEADGRVYVHYQNCDNGLAIQVTPTGPDHYRIVVFFNKDEYSRDIRNRLLRKNKPAAIFDSFGNGVVYDIEGKIRLLFDQAEGKLFDFLASPETTVEHPPLHWKWQNFEKVALKRQLLYKRSFPRNPPDFRQYLPQPKMPANFEDEKTAVNAVNNGVKLDKEQEARDLHRSKHNTDGKLDIGPSKSKTLQNTDGKSNIGPLKSKNLQNAEGKSNVGPSKSKTLNRKASRTQSGSSEKSTSPITTRSSSRVKAQKGKKAKRKSQRESSLIKYDVCASDLTLADPVFVKDENGKASVETPIRLVMKIEKGITLVIMNQCHIHLKFQEGQKHLIFNLGVQVKINEDLQSQDTVKLNPSASSLHDMFSVFAHKSSSLRDLLGRTNIALEEQVEGSHHKGNTVVCLRPESKKRASKPRPCIEHRVPEHAYLECDLQPDQPAPCDLSRW